jgi:hypothetical protein
MLVDFLEFQFAFLESKKIPSKIRNTFCFSAAISGKRNFVHHGIETNRRSTQPPKKRNRCHSMIRHQNAVAMFLAKAVMRGIHPLNVRHFEYFQGGKIIATVTQKA